MSHTRLMWTGWSLPGLLLALGVSAADVVAQPVVVERAREVAAQAPARQAAPAKQADDQPADPLEGQGARPSAAPGKPQPPKAPEGAYEVYEWVVLMCDPNQPLANGERMFPNTLPDFASSRRTAAPPESAAEPSPAGVIRIVPIGGAGGAAAAERTKLDVLVQCPTGRFVATWPKGKGRPNRQLWEAYELAAEPATLKELPPKHWFAPLRGVESLFLRRGRVNERFLLYDAELNYPLPLRVTGGGKSAYQLSNSGGTALHDVTVFKPQDGRWSTGLVATMPPAKGVAPATRPAGPATNPAANVPPGVPPEVAARLIQRRGGNATLGPPGAAAPAPIPSTQPAPGASTASVAADSPPGDARAALAGWSERLKAAGLAPGDVSQIVRVLERHALDKRRMTVAYRLDPAELDRLLPLEVTPAPRKTVRVGVVIARNIDPAVGDEIDQLVKQLGHAEWEQREAAYKQLAELGPAARPKLQAALQQKDMEVVWRAERLIQLLDTPPGALPRQQ